METKKPTRVEYMCRWCGARAILRYGGGRPSPGICPRKPKVKGRSLPHTWVINRKF